jgi:hypothetical protein
MTMTIYELSSASGATVVFVAMWVLSLAIALGLYALIVRYASNRELFQGGPAVPPFLAAILCTVLFGLLFKGMHATALQGFYRIELLDNEVRLHSLFPAHTVTLSRDELAQAECVSAVQGLGYLRLHTVQGTTYKSMLVSERAVRESWTGINAYLGCLGAPEHPGGEVERIARDLNSASRP